MSLQQIADDRQIGTEYLRKLGKEYLNALT